LFTREVIMLTTSTLLAVLLLQAAPGQEYGPPKGGIKWNLDLDAALKRSAKEEKPVIADFTVET
jgi:hypothetical protein